MLPLLKVVNNLPAPGLVVVVVVVMVVVVVVVEVVMRDGGFGLGLVTFEQGCCTCTFAIGEAAK